MNQQNSCFASPQAAKAAANSSKREITCDAFQFPSKLISPIQDPPTLYEEHQYSVQSWWLPWQTDVTAAASLIGEHSEQERRWRSECEQSKEEFSSYLSYLHPDFVLAAEEEKVKSSFEDDDDLKRDRTNNFDSDNCNLCSLLSFKEEEVRGRGEPPKQLYPTNASQLEIKKQDKNHHLIQHQQRTSGQLFPWVSKSWATTSLHSSEDFNRQLSPSFSPSRLFPASYLSNTTCSQQRPVFSTPNKSYNSTKLAHFDNQEIISSHQVTDLFWKEMNQEGELKQQKKHDLDEIRRFKPSQHNELIKKNENIQEEESLRQQDQEPQEQQQVHCQFSNLSVSKLQRHDLRSNLSLCGDQFQEQQREEIGAKQQKEQGEVCVHSSNSSDLIDSNHYIEFDGDSICSSSFFASDNGVEQSLLHDLLQRKISPLKQGLQLSQKNMQPQSQQTSIALLSQERKPLSSLLLPQPRYNSPEKRKMVKTTTGSAVVVPLKEATADLRKDQLCRGKVKRITLDESQPMTTLRGPCLERMIDQQTGNDDYRGAHHPLIRGQSKSYKSKFDTKNLVKNFLNQFTSFIGQSEEEEVVIELISAATCSANLSLLDLVKYREVLKLFLKGKKFNRTLLKEFILVRHYRIVFAFFLQHRAAHWIASGRMKDKPSHSRALDNFLFICENHGEIKSWRFRYNFV